MHHPEVDAPPSHSLFVSSSCFTLLINKRIFFHLSTTLYPTNRLTSSASSASSRFLSLARVYAELSERFSFREAGARVAGSQRDGSHDSGCAAACREMARRVILANHRSLRTWEDEWVIFPTVPGAAQPLPPGAPEPGAPTEEEGLVPADRASTSSEGGKGGETAREEQREAASEPQSGAGSGGGQPDPKRRRVDGTDQQAADLRTLLDGNRVSSLTPVPREVSLN